MAQVGVIGAGSWGTALALRLVLSGHEVSIYDLDGEVVDDIKNNKRNSKYLGDIELPGNLSAVSDLSECIRDKDVILMKKIESAHPASAYYPLIPEFAIPSTNCR